MPTIRGCQDLYRYLFHNMSIDMQTWFIDISWTFSMVADSQDSDGTRSSATMVFNKSPYLVISVCLSFNCTGALVF